MDILIHVIVATFGLLAIYFGKKRNDYVPSLFGFIFIVFAVYSCVESEQWGILVLCMVYGYAWGYELLTRILSKPKELGWSYDEFIYGPEIPKDVLDELHKSKDKE